MTKTLKIGIASYEQIKARTLAIARGERRPDPGEPKIWFTSLDSVAKILSPENRKLLQAIVDTSPRSLQDLADTVGREKSNVSRTLKTMEKYGFVTIEKSEGRVVPKVPNERVSFELSLVSST
jgi:predicted transcriptional regulator